jgi:hypothetical protein
MEIFGRATDAERPGSPELTYYTFAVRNAEDSPLTAPFSVELALEKTRARFEGGPRLYCGLRTRVASSRVVLRTDPRDPSTEREEASEETREVYVIDVERMRARETWVIWCLTKTTAAHVVLRVRPRVVFEGAALPLPLVEPLELRLTQRSGVRTSVNVRLAAVLTMMLCGLLYLYPTINRDGTVFGIGEVMRPLALWDAGMLILLAIVGFAFYRSTAGRGQPPFVQGYRYYVDRFGRDKRTESL